MKLNNFIIMSVSTISIIATSALAYSGGPWTDSTSKGSITVTQEYDWPSSTPALDVEWWRNTADYFWTSNNAGEWAKICYELWDQPLQNACWLNKLMVDNSGVGPVRLTYDNQQSSPFNENALYTVNVYAYGKKRPSGLFGNLDPATWYNKWRKLGRVAKVETVDVLPCNEPLEWWTTPAEDAGWDGANCHVWNVPSQYGQPFIWNERNFYVPLPASGTCDIGNFDGANCWLGRAPVGTKAFVWGAQNGIYYGSL